ncbi:MAG TPA: carboxypeptidase regulatory-like domain-containing protein [Pyrinomonadaceae bacterium]|nr:carboxypeptidase regulatory-like domain-containing protein [Pyrinomonadaceae bacterium]
MRIQKFTHFFVAVLLLAACAATTAAQQVAATGKVTLKQADGKEVPVVGATVEIHRIDIKQTLKTKTDKKGEYVYAGLDLVGTYTILVSAPGATPSYLPNIRISQRSINNFSLTPGDGRVLTLAELTAAAASTGGTGAAATPKMTAEEAKRLDEEAAKLRAEVEAKNAKITERNEKLPVVFNAGNEAVKASNSLKGAEKVSKLDEAIAAYNQGIAIDPDEMAVYRNKQIALRSRGVEKYNMGVVAKDKAAKEAGIEAGRNDLKEAVEAGEKAVAIFRTSKAAATATPANGENPEISILEDRAETYRRALQIKSPIDNDVAARSIEEYINAETDPAKKEKMQSSLGDALFYAGRVDDAVVKFREILAKNPNNTDAVYGLGLALASTDPPQLVEARNMLQQAANKAPEGSSRKQEALEMVKYLDATIQGEAANKAQDNKADKGRTGRRKP